MRTSTGRKLIAAQQSATSAAAKLYIHYTATDILHTPLLTQALSNQILHPSWVSKGVFAIKKKGTKPILPCSAPLRSLRPGDTVAYVPSSTASTDVLPPPTADGVLKREGRGAPQDAEPQEAHTEDRSAVRA